MFKFFRKKTKKSDEPKTGGANIAEKLKENSSKFSKFMGEKFELAQEEFSNIKEKCNNLLETNLELGLKHLENGHLPEAIFRFRFINKFWPNCFDAYYHLAYSLFLKEKDAEAKKVLQKLLKKNPDYDPVAQKLLTHLNNSDADDKNY